MDAIRVAKVDRVLYSKPGLRAEGTLHLTAHHIIFKYGVPNADEKEIWVPYPLISTVARLPLSLHGQSPLAFRSRTFEFFTLTFTRDRDALDVFESVKELTVAASVTSLYAFFYQPNPPYTITDGWSLYSMRDEFTRMGLGSRSKAWRFTDINKEYSICPTYPARLVVPAKISDSTLTYGAKYRSKGRIPALVYLHWNNQASITRSSQPTVGLTNSRSVQDEKLIEAIFQSHHLASSPYASIPANRANTAVYGATATNIIIDARSATSGVANVARGGGTENMEYYKEGRKVYLGIENIHVMRDSLAKVAEALRDADTIVSSPELVEGGKITGVLDRQALRRSGWLKHISGLIDGANIIVRNVHINSSHVLIHCSDGWDRTAQLSTLAQLCLDPYYRTYRGFQVLVEKDWVSFGHRFLDRCGHLSSEKFFLTPSVDGAAEGPQAFFQSVQNKFTSPSHIKETSPVFHQFLECVRQIQRQYPARFEFNERYLERLHYHLYSCQFGTFLFNNERDRRVAPDATSQAAYMRTCAVWDELNSEPECTRLLNPDYDASLDARDGSIRGGDLGVLFPDPKDVKFWHELYGRTDEDMNGRLVTAQADGVEVMGVEGSSDDTTQASTPSRPPLPLLADEIDAAAPSQIVPSPSANSHHPTSSGGTPRALSPSPGGSSTVLGHRDNNASNPWGAGSSSILSPDPLTPSNASVHSLPSFPLSRTSSPSRKGSASTTAFAANAAGGMKSLWGHFTTNASAALSVVQDAYEGTAKEILGAGGKTGTSSRDRELSDTVPSSRQPWGSTSTSENWGRSPSNTLPAELDDPWSSHSQTPPRERHLSSGGSPTLQMPVDPPRFSSLSARQSPARGSILQLPSSSSPTLTRSSSAAELSSPTKQVAGLNLGGSGSVSSPWSLSTREGSLPLSQPSPPIPISPTSPIPLPSQNPYIGISRAQTPDESSPTSLRPTPAQTQSTSSIGSGLDAPLPIPVPKSRTRSPSPRPETAPVKTTPTAATDGRELDPLGVGFLG